MPVNAEPRNASSTSALFQNKCKTLKQSSCKRLLIKKTASPQGELQGYFPHNLCKMTQKGKSDSETEGWGWIQVSAESDNAKLHYTLTEGRKNYCTSPKQVQMIQTSIHKKIPQTRQQILSETCVLAYQADCFQNNNTTSMHNLNRNPSLNADVDFQIGVQAPCDQLLGQIFCACKIWTGFWHHSPLSGRL